MEDPSQPEPTRRKFLRTGLLGAAATSLWACDPCTGTAGPGVVTKKRVRWRLASSFPSSLDTIYGASVVLADRLREMTDGNFDIRVHEAGELVPGLQVWTRYSRAGSRWGKPQATTTPVKTQPWPSIPACPLA